MKIGRIIVFPCGTEVYPSNHSPQLRLIGTCVSLNPLLEFESISVPCNQLSIIGILG